MNPPTDNTANTSEARSDKPQYTWWVLLGRESTRSLRWVRAPYLPNMSFRDNKVLWIWPELENAPDWRILWHRFIDPDRSLPMHARFGVPQELWPDDSEINYSMEEKP